MKSVLLSSALATVATMTACSQSDHSSSTVLSYLDTNDADAVCAAAGTEHLPRAEYYSYFFGVSGDGPTYYYANGYFEFNAPFSQGPNRIVDANAAYNQDLVAEAGKRLSLRYTGGIANRVHDTDGFRLYAGYKIDGHDVWTEMTLHPSPSLTYTAYTLDLVVPGASDGKLQLWFEGRYNQNGVSKKIYDSNGGANYQVQVVESASKSLCFSTDWREAQSGGELRAGDSVAIVYDVGRLTRRMAGPTYAAWPAWSAYAHYEVRDASGNKVAGGRVPLFAHAIDPTNGSSSTVRPSYKPLIATPASAVGGELILWFEGPNRGPTVWDSDLGANYRVSLR